MENHLENKVEENQRELTFGEKAVGVKFNPSKNDSVDNIKAKFASIIDDLNNMRNDSQMGPEVKRLCSVAITEAQGAQMWAVKALTWVEV